MINDISENKIMESFYNMIPYFEHFFGCELGFTISNTERFLYVKYNDRFKMETKSQKAMPKVGDIIPTNSAADVCLRKKAKIYFDVPESVFGIPVKTAAIPIFVNSKVEGTIVMAISKKKQRDTVDLANTLYESLSKFNTAVSEMMEGFEQISRTNLGIEEYIEDFNLKSKETDEIINFVKDIADNTNLLSFNAAIEAARVGEAGKGFGVVAKEIRNLSSFTKQSTEEFRSVLDNIKQTIEEIGKNLNSSNKLLESQVLEVAQMSDEIQRLNDVANELKFASELL